MYHIFSITIGVNHRSIIYAISKKLRFELKFVSKLRGITKFLEIQWI